MSHELRCAALDYATLGFPVLPLHTPTRRGCTCRRPDCDRAGKHPRHHPEWFTNGLHQASTDPDTIDRWWTMWPNANVGLRTGEVADVCDIDSPAGLTALRQLLDITVPTGPIVRTGSGGWHLYYQPTGLGNRVAVVPGVDWRGRHGYVVAPPSRHATGNHYRWTWPLTQPLPACPDTLRHLIDPPQPTPTTTTPVRNPDRYGRAALAAEVDRVRTAPAPHGHGPTRTPGGRNHALNAAAFHLGQLVAAHVLDEQHVIDALTDAGLRASLSRTETHRTIQSGLRAGMRHPRHPGAPDHD